MFVSHMFIRSFWKTIVCLLVISLLSFLPLKSSDNTPFINIPHLDKLAHFIMYAILSAFLLQGISLFRNQLNPFINILYTAGIVIIYGVFIEYIQMTYVSYREGDLLDILFNSAGCLCGIVLYRILPARKMSRRS